MEAFLLKIVVAVAIADGLIFAWPLLTINLDNLFRARLANIFKPAKSNRAPPKETIMTLCIIH
jgi:hypothetical protein